MNILVACEESQAVCKAFRAKGHTVYSCDMLECSGGHPEWHIQGDVLPLLDGRCEFTTMDGEKHTMNSKWDMIIAFPPCTYLTNTGNRWFNIERYGDKARQRWQNRYDALEFVKKIWGADCDKLVIENPIGYLNNNFMKPTQIVHPYYFAKEDGDVNCERKATCLFERGVEPLEYEIKFKPRVIEYKNGKGTDSPWHMNTMSLPPAERARARSKTYPGVAEAMAEQWG